MSAKPIFVATHPRSCSTAFERVFMTRHDTLKCVHEPFGDAYYFGPERLAERYENDEESRTQSGFQNTTYNTVMDRINRENTEGKRLLIKDMAQYLVPPDGKPVSIAPSLVDPRRGVGTNGFSGSTVKTSGPLSDDAINVHGNGVASQKVKSGLPYATAVEPKNPTVVPDALLQQFHFTFLIRHPHFSIPSYYRCTVPPLDSKTGFYNFMPSEAGYDELRRLFDHLLQTGQIGPRIAGQPSSDRDSAIGMDGLRKTSVDICVIDADDMLDHPSEMIEAFCKSVGIDYDPQMLDWDNEDHQREVKKAFEKWIGFHDDALDSKGLKPRLQKKKAKSDEEYYETWKARYGEDGARVIQETVRKNIADYEYLKRFALKV